MEDSNGNGYRNTAVGYHSLRNAGAVYENTCIGYTSGDNITTGVRNVTIGASVDTSSNSVSNEYVLGYNTTGNGANTFMFTQRVVRITVKILLLGLKHRY